MRTPTPHLVNTPSPSGKYANFAAYIDACVQQVGTNHALGTLLGFTSGTRVSDWRKARGGRPAMSSCLRLAKLTHDNPLDILVMGGYEEEAKLLQELWGDIPSTDVSYAEMLQPLETIESAIERLKYVKGKLEGLIK